MSDKFYLSVLWKMAMGYEIDWKNPKTFNEKLQWLKLNDRNSLYTTLVDKYRVKQWVADKIGEQYVIPTLAVYKSVEEIDLNKLPDQFVLKCNHDSGSVAICRDKSTFDLDAAKRKLGAALKKNYFWEAREWPYKNVKRCVFAEKYMHDDSSKDGLMDFKLFNFAGVPKMIQVDFDRFKFHKRNLYDTNWNFIDARIQYPNDPNKIIERPKMLEKMLLLSQTLSEPFPQVRTDFYLINNNIYFGEMTFFHGAGTEKFVPLSLGDQFGKWIELPERMS